LLRPEFRGQKFGAEDVPTEAVTRYAGFTQNVDAGEKDFTIAECKAKLEK